MNHAEYKALIARKAPRRPTAKPIGLLVDRILDAARDARRRTRAARAAWESVAASDIVDRCEVWVEKATVVVECVDRMALARAIRQRATIVRAVVGRVSGVTGVQITLAEGV